MRAFVRFVDNHTCEMDCLSFPPEEDDNDAIVQKKNSALAMNHTTTH